MPDSTYDIVVIGAGPGGYVAAIRAAFPGEQLHLISAKYGDNLETATAFLASLPGEIAQPADAVAVNLRQKDLLEKLRGTIHHVLRLQAREPAPGELVAEELRQGLHLIGELTGSIGVDDVLRGVFARFCIGK